MFCCVVFLGRALRDTLHPEVQMGTEGGGGHLIKYLRGVGVGIN